MAQEVKRGCGYRKVGGLYLCGEYVYIPCDRLPYPLICCPTCGSGIRLSRAYIEISPAALFGQHEGCRDQYQPCYMCQPGEDQAYIMTVGDKHYTPTEFMAEAKMIGISKRIPFIPNGLVLGETVIYLAHPKACIDNRYEVLQEVASIVDHSSDLQPRLVDAEEVKRCPGIFTAFIPQRIEMPVWASEYKHNTEKMEALCKRGITPIPIKDGDQDHI